MARHRTNLAIVERRRNLALERQAKAREEDNALEDRMAETVERGEARGEEFDRAPQKRGEGRKPIRRLSGLEWLHKKGKLTAEQVAVGERYGRAYRKAKGDGAIKSILNRDVAASEGPTVEQLKAHAEAVQGARERLAYFRRLLLNQDGLVRACDRICGDELTPREASVNGKTADGLEALVRVALDILALHLVGPDVAAPQNVEKAA